MFRSQIQFRYYSWYAVSLFINSCYEQTSIIFSDQVFWRFGSYSSAYFYIPWRITEIEKKTNFCLLGMAKLMCFVIFYRGKNILKSHWKHSWSVIKLLLGRAICGLCNKICENLHKGYHPKKTADRLVSARGQINAGKFFPKGLFKSEVKTNALVSVY